MMKSFIKRYIHLLLFCSIPLVVFSKLIIEDYFISEDILRVNSIRSTDLVCKNDVCYKDYYFKIPGHVSFVNPSVGFYSAFVDSTIKVGKSSFYKDILNTKGLVSSWWNFQNFRISKNDFGKELVVRTFSENNTKKNGMSKEFIYLGSASSIDSLEYSWKFINIYSYIFLGFICLLVGFLANTVQDKKFNPFVHSLVLFLGLIGLSHSADNLFYSLGISNDALMSIVRFSYLYSIWYSIFQINGKKNNILVYCGVIVFAFSCFPSSYSNLVLNGFYRWLVSISSISLFYSSIKKRKLSIILLSLYFIWDSLVLFGLLNLSTGIYMSPIALGLLFISLNNKKVKRIIRNNLSWIRKEEIKNELAEVEKLDLSYKELKDLLIKVLRSLMYDIGSSRGSICFFNDNNPIIVNVTNSTIKTIDDGIIPEVFGKVIQSGDPIWWASDDQFNQLRQGDNENTFGISSVVPIKVSKKIFGALSVTGFQHSMIEVEEDLLTIENTIESYIDLITRYLIYNENLSGDLLLKTRKKLNDTLSNQLIKVNDSLNAYQYLCESVSENLDVIAMVFSFQEDDRSLTLCGFSGERDEIKDEWSKVPFKARHNNKISPFAVAVNEKKQVFVSNIKSYYSILKSKHSQRLFELTDTSGFYCNPIIIDENVNSLLVILEKQNSNFFNNELNETLSVAISYLTYKLREIEIKESENRKDKLLNKFVPEEAKNQILSDGIAFEKDHGMLLMIDLRSSTKISSISSEYADEFVDCVESVRNLIVPKAMEYNFVLQKINWDAFYFTYSYDKESSLNIEKLTEFVEYVHEACKISYVKHFDDLISSPHHISNHCCRIVFTEGDISRSMINIGSTNSWGIHGTIMAEICKLEDACKKLDGYYYTFESVVKKYNLLNWHNTEVKVDSTDELIYEFVSSFKKSLAS